MEYFNDILSVLFRWLHIGAGILWIGLLYFFNWVNGPFMATQDGDSKKKIIPELAPRALYFFRWGAAYTVLFGILLLWFVFWSGGIMFDAGNTTGWSAAAIIMLVLVFLAPHIYDFLAKSAIGKNPKVFAAIAFVLLTAAAYCFQNVAGYSYRAYVIHFGAMLGIMMAFNVWFRIWPSQKKIINGVKNGPPADAAVVALAGTRSKHNTYMSVPLVYTMINAHTAIPGADSWLYLPGAVLVGWGLVWWMYKKAATVKGF